MRRSYSPHAAPSPGVTGTADAEAIAYSCLEQARLRVERLATNHEGDLSACHRHLGLAGYHCSSQLAAETRLQWLALAHDRLRSDDCDPVRAAVKAIVQATDAVEHALVASDLAERIQDTHLHCLAACESFQLYVQST